MTSASTSAPPTVPARLIFHDGHSIEQRRELLSVLELTFWAGDARKYRPCQLEDGDDDDGECCDGCETHSIADAKGRSIDFYISHAHSSARYVGRRCADDQRMVPSFKLFFYRNDESWIEIEHKESVGVIRTPEFVYVDRRATYSGESVYDESRRANYVQFGRTQIRRFLRLDEE
jgi:hypothetical protein